MYPARRIAVLGAPWVRNDLWRRARAVPSLDLRFAENKSLTDAVTRRSLVTFTRASSGTYVGSDGQIKTAATDEARFDHSPTTGESLGLLVEEQRTNLLAYSEQFDNAAWIKGDSTLAANIIAAPDGTTSADKLIPNNGTFIGRLRANVTLADSTVYTLSVFFKAAEFKSVVIQLFDKAGGVIGSRTLDLSTGALSGLDSGGTTSVQTYANGWYRLILAGANSLTGVTAPNVRFQCTETGDGISGIYIWGAQLEAGAFPTGYIPTTTNAATRSADVASITNTAFSSWYRQNEGTMFATYSLPNSVTTSGARVYELTNSGGTDFVWLRMQAGVNRIYDVTTSSVSQAAFNQGAFTAQLEYRGALAFATNNFGFSENGSASQSDSSGTMPSVDRMGVGMSSTGAVPLNGTISRLTYWPARLPNTTLQEITR